MIVATERCSFEYISVQMCSVQSSTQEFVMGRGPQKWRKHVKKKAKKLKPRTKLGDLKKGLRDGAGIEQDQVPDDKQNVQNS